MKIKFEFELSPEELMAAVMKDQDFEDFRVKLNYAASKYFKEPDNRPPDVIVPVPRVKRKYTKRGKKISSGWM